MSDLLTFREKWNGPSFLERSPTSHRMRERDGAGKTSKKPKEKIPSLFEGLK